MNDFPDISPIKTNLQCRSILISSSREKQRGISRIKDNEVTSTSIEAKSIHDLKSQEIHQKLQKSVGDKLTNQRNKSQERPLEGKNLNFKYELDDEVFSFTFKLYKRVLCSKCGESFENVLNHIKKGNCKMSNFEVQKDQHGYRNKKNQRRQKLKQLQNRGRKILRK